MENKIKIFRAEKGISQSQLAEIAKVTKWTISQMELNNYVPSVKLAQRIAAYFGTTTDKIFFFDDDE